MWVFYLVSLLLTVGMVILTLRYFAGPGVPRYVFSTVAYTWFCSLSMIILVPADIWISLHEKIGHENGAISFFWSWTYWSTFLLTWAVVPLIQGYEDAGDFTMTERLKTSVHVNLVFYLILGAVGLFGLILLVIMKKNWFGDEGVLGFAMASSNTFGLVTGAFLLGFGLSEIPKSIWRNADWSIRQKVLSHKIAKMAVKLDDAHQEFSNTIVVAQATSNQMSKRDPLRRYMDVIDGMLYQMFKEDPNFKPQGGRLGENDMDYDTDAKSMATLRRNLRIAREEYYRYKSEYMTYVMEALELEDTTKKYECRDATGWIFISSFRPSRTGTIGLLFDKLELVWRCILRKQLERLFAIILGCLSATILLAEATLLTNRVDLFLFSKLINSVADEEMLVQVFAFLPLMYMCVCTYYSLFQIGMLMFYSLTPRQTSSISLLMICSMVARYAPPISYNYLNLIRLDDNKITVFEKRMGNIDRAVPFFGKGFNKIYPLIMVIYTLLVASNFFDRVIRFFGNWKRLRFQTEADDTDGFDPSGLIILQRERTWLEQGHQVGEQVIPLARNFNNTSMDVEASSDGTGKTAVEMKAASSLNADNIKSSPSKPPLHEDYRYGSTRDAISNKYAVRRDKIRQGSTPIPVDKNMVKAGLLATDNSETGTSEGPPRGIAAKWESVKTGFKSFKANIGAKRFLPLRQAQEGTLVSRVSSSEKLDEIFQRLKRPALDHEMNSDDDEDSGLDVKIGGPIR